jgi:hypothetical protein
MAHMQVLSPTHADNDVLILDGVRRGVETQGARYGLSQPRRALLTLALSTLIDSLQRDYEARLRDLLTQLQAGRPSQPGDGHGHTHLSDQAPRIPG